MSVCLESDGSCFSEVFDEPAEDESTNTEPTYEEIYACLEICNNATLETDYCEQMCQIQPREVMNDLAAVEHVPELVSPHEPDVEDINGQNCYDSCVKKYWYKSYCSYICNYGSYRTRRPTTTSTTTTTKAPTTRQTSFWWWRPTTPTAPRPQTPRPWTPRPQTPRPQTPRPQTPRPQTPRPQTPPPQTPRPQTIRPSGNRQCGYSSALSTQHISEKDGSDEFFLDITADSDTKAENATGDIYVDLNITSIVVNGKDVTVKHKYPWLVALRTNSGHHYCGGAIINDRWVLSAAHCEFNIRNDKVIIGAHYRATRGDEISMKVVENVKHPKGAKTNR